MVAKHKLGVRKRNPKLTLHLHLRNWVSMRQQLGEEAISYAHAVKIEALAQLGAMLKEMEKHSGGNPVPKKNRVHSDDGLLGASQPDRSLFAECR